MTTLGMEDCCQGGDQSDPGKVENLRAATSLHFAHYNFVRRHSTIKTTPAVASGVAGHQWKLAEFVEWGEMYGR